MSTDQYLHDLSSEDGPDFEPRIDVVTISLEKMRNLVSLPYGSDIAKEIISIIAPKLSEELKEQLGFTQVENGAWNQSTPNNIGIRMTSSVQYYESDGSMQPSLNNETGEKNNSGGTSVHKPLQTPINRSVKEIIDSLKSTGMESKSQTNLWIGVPQIFGDLNLGGNKISDVAEYIKQKGPLDGIQKVIPNCITITFYNLEVLTNENITNGLEGRSERFDLGKNVKTPSASIEAREGYYDAIQVVRDARIHSIVIAISEYI